MKKAAGISGLVLAVVFMILGFTTAAPDKYIKSYGTGKMTEYVGGDAYNFIIEASLRGGEISGALTAKAVYFATAALLGIVSLSLLEPDQTEMIRKALSALEKKLSASNENIHALQAGIEKSINNGIQTQTENVIQPLKNEIIPEKPDSSDNEPDNSSSNEITEQQNATNQT